MVIACLGEFPRTDPRSGNYKAICMPSFFVKSLDAAIQAIAARTSGDCPICNSIV
jgi:hypothetical protein